MGLGRISAAGGDLNKKAWLLLKPLRDIFQLNNPFDNGGVVEIMMEFQQYYSQKPFPVSLMMVIGLLCGWSLFSHRLKLGFIVSCFLVLYWVLADERVFWVDLLGGQSIGAFVYMATCLTTVLAGMLVFFHESH